MDPMTLAALSSIANIGGGILGNELSRGDRTAAEDQIKGIQALYNNIKLPSVDDQKLNLQQYGQGQQMSAQLDNAQQLAAQDALQNVNLDPRLKQTQMNALETLSKISGKGFTPDELNAIQQQRDAREGDLTSKLKQIQQQQDMRGIGNSDMALSQKMLEAQSSANRGAQDARDMQAQAFKRSLDAVSQGANLAGNIDATDYARQAQLAQNLNSRELQNLQQRSQVSSSNVDRFNRALESNVNRANTVADNNVNLGNQQQGFNKGLLDKNFQNELQLAAGKAGTNRDAAAMYQNRADRTAQQISGIGSGIGQGLLSLPNNKNIADTTKKKPTIETA